MTHPRKGLAAAIRKHRKFGEFCRTDSIRTALDICSDLRAIGWAGCVSTDVRKAARQTKRIGRPRKPPAEHELQCPHCHKPIIVETAR